MSKKGLGSEIKRQFLHGSMTIRLLLINLFVFLFIHFSSAIIVLLDAGSSWYSNTHFAIFILKTRINSFIYQPWALFTNFFAHYDILHFLQNMLFLYFIGRIFEQEFGSKKLFWVYFIGGTCGGIFEILANSFFPALQNIDGSIIGASGSVMALLSAMAFYNPNFRVFLFGSFQIRIIFIALSFWIIDIVNLSNGLQDKIAHFAHLGGIFFGYLAVQNIDSKNNVLNFFDKIWEKFRSFFKRNRAKSNSRKANFKKDEDYAYEKNLNQKKTDSILDKISKSGYESLSQEEKDFLFNQSKKL